MISGHCPEILRTGQREGGRKRKKYYILHTELKVPQISRHCSEDSYSGQDKLEPPYFLIHTNPFSRLAFEKALEVTKFSIDAESYLPFNIGKH